MKIRFAKISDAEKLINLFKKLDKETNFMLLKPDERKTTIEEQTNILTDFDRSDNKAMIVIENESQLLGVAIGISNTTRRNKHTMYCVMGIVQAATGQGLGYKLLEHLQKWATQNNITRMELTVILNNSRAKRLYEKFGFEIEGIKRQSMMVDDGLGDKIYIDEFMMAKLLA